MGGRQTGAIIVVRSSDFGSIVFICLLLRPQRLTLDQEGFCLSGGLMPSSRVKKILLRDIESIFPLQTGRGNKMIGLNFKPGASEHTRLARFSRAKFGADGALPGLWPGGTERMIQLLTDYQERALAITDKYGA